MRDLAFYEAGCDELSGIKRVIIPVRRVLRRLLRPIFLRLDSQLQAIDRRQNQIDRDSKAVLGMGLDHVAMARRLAVLEDRVEALMSRELDGDSQRSSERNARSLVPYPRRDERPDSAEVGHTAGAQSRVS